MSHKQALYVSVKITFLCRPASPYLLQADELLRQAVGQRTPLPEAGLDWVEGFEGAGFSSREGSVGLRV